MKLLIYCLLFTISQSNCKTNETENYQNSFIRNFNNYSMAIEAAGIAAMPVVKLSSNNKLYIEYKYTSGNENRTGKTTLQLIESNHFEGTWETIADNGTIYSGSLYLDFKENGEASG